MTVLRPVKHKVTTCRLPETRMKYKQEDLNGPDLRPKQKQVRRYMHQTARLKIALFIRKVPFKRGDRVIVSKGKRQGQTGTVITSSRPRLGDDHRWRVRFDSSQCPTCWGTRCRIHTKKNEDGVMKCDHRKPHMILCCIPCGSEPTKCGTCRDCIDQVFQNDDLRLHSDGNDSRRRLHELSGHSLISRQLREELRASTL